MGNVLKQLEDLKINFLQISVEEMFEFLNMLNGSGLIVTDDKLLIFRLLELGFKSGEQNGKLRMEKWESKNPV